MIARPVRTVRHASSIITSPTDIPFHPTRVRLTSPLIPPIMSKSIFTAILLPDIRPASRSISLLILVAIRVQPIATSYFPSRTLVISGHNRLTRNTRR